MTRRGCLSVLVACSIGFGVYHFREDIFGSVDKKFHILESSSVYDEREARKYEILLVEDIPQLMSNRKKCIETLFWKNISLDTLLHYGFYKVILYKKTKYLTEDFIEGGAYSIAFDAIDETMSWRNHIDDRVARIIIPIDNKGTAYYNLTVFDSGYGFDALINVEDHEYWSERYKSAEQLYLTKRKELGLED